MQERAQQAMKGGHLLLAPVADGACGHRLLPGGALQRHCRQQWLGTAGMVCCRRGRAGGRQQRLTGKHIVLQAECWHNIGTH